MHLSIWNHLDNSNRKTKSGHLTEPQTTDFVVSSDWHLCVHITRYHSSSWGAGSALKGSLINKTELSKYLMLDFFFLHRNEF